MVFQGRNLALLTAAVALAAVFLLAVPAIAAAANTFVDSETGSDGNDCTDSSTPCQTIAAGIAQAGTDDTISVADGTYAESLNLGDGKSLVAQDSNDPKPVIDNGSDPNPALTVDVGGAGSVDGFTVRSDFQPLLIAGSVTVVNSSFDEDSVPSSNGSDVDVEDAASVLIINNDFTDPDATGAQTGITTSGTQTPVISSNTFSGLATAIEAGSGGATITGNQLTGAHSAGSDPGIAIEAVGGDPAISDNSIGPAGTGPSIGVLMQDQHTVSSGTQLSRNEVFGNDVGVRVAGATVPVALADDLIHGNGTGLEAVNSISGGEARANGVSFDNTVDVSLDNSILTIDSSILMTPVDLLDGISSCDISHSRGDATPVANGCSDFDTNADPQFVDAANGDYRLQDSSPMIDAGNPTAPDPGALDFFGNPRAVQGLPCDGVVRDIGAAEFQPSSAPECAQNTYADPSGGDDDDDCLSPAEACRTIAAALERMAPDETTFLAAGTYSESLTVGGGRSLAPLDSSGPDPLIDAPPGDVAIEVPASGAGEISGLQIRSDRQSVDVGGPVTIDDNLFDSPDVSSQSDVNIEAAGGVTVSENQFTDPDADGPQIGVAVSSPDAVISGNTFTGLAAGVGVFSGEPQVSGNLFSGAHPVGSTPFGNLPGAGILAVNSNPTISGNTVGAPSGHPSDGIFIKLATVGLPVDAGATLSHNRITANDAGVQVIDTDQPVTLSNDLIYGNTTGVASTDTSADSPPSAQGDVSITDATVFGNAVDLQLSYTTATLDSTILSVPVDMVGGNGACQITYSRGSAAPSANGCGNFDSTADPQFVDPGSGNYRLQAGSPLIDIGDPAAPGAGATDFYGDQRAVQGRACSTVRRDIGAAEYVPASTPDCPPPPPTTVQPQPPADDSPPAAPKIAKHPERRSDDTSPTFRFFSDVSGAGFRCRLDDGPYKRCVSPKTYRGVEIGKHVFRVYVVDPDGSRSKSRVFRFTVVESGWRGTDRGPGTGFA